MMREFEPDVEPFDLVVIGSGPAGEKAAAKAAYLGKRIALIERSRHELPVRVKRGHATDVHDAALFARQAERETCREPGSGGVLRSRMLFAASASRDRAVPRGRPAWWA